MMTSGDAHAPAYYNNMIVRIGTLDDSIRIL